MVRVASGLGLGVNPTLLPLFPALEVLKWLGLVQG